MKIVPEINELKIIIYASSLNRFYGHYLRFWGVLEISSSTTFFINYENVTKNTK